LCTPRDGIDVVYVGPTDLSISLGVAGDVFHPRVEAAAKRIRDAAEWRGVPVANVIYNPFDRTEIERKIGEGYKLFSVFLDVQLFRQSLERLYDEVRAAL
jgi:4-hydroxy-2-oxoheptanedioate aldolase